LRDLLLLAHYQSREVPTIERFSSSKTSSGGLRTAHYKEVPTIERCPLIEVLLYKKTDSSSHFNSQRRRADKAVLRPLFIFGLFAYGSNQGWSLVIF
jgi:hypothetical protein